MEKSKYMDCAEGQYDYIKRMSELYGLLQDQQSKDIFWARMKYDIEPNLDHAFALLNTMESLPEDDRDARSHWHEILTQILEEGGKIVFFGAGDVGRTFADSFQKENIEFEAFCATRRYGRNFCGKPVISPEELLRSGDESYVLITSDRYYTEIYQHLVKIGFPEDHIIHGLSAKNGDGTLGKSYFEFPELFLTYTAFVDAGCLDGYDSIHFAEWCGGRYSEIIACEPDPENHERSVRKLKEAGVERVRVLSGGLCDRTCDVEFRAFANGSSHVASGNAMDFPAEEETVMVHMYALDEVVPDTRVGMIKMDIEGAELDALRGAKKTLLRDKPLLAICVYHKQGDMLAIMDYLNGIVPEYRFWLRHYETLQCGTVLYASI